MNVQCPCNFKLYKYNNINDSCKFMVAIFSSHTWRMMTETSLVFSERPVMLINLFNLIELFRPIQYILLKMFHDWIQIARGKTWENFKV